MDTSIQKEKIKDGQCPKAGRRVIQRQMNPDQKREFYKSLRERINQLRMNHLFEEPCPLYEPEWDEDYIWDCRLSYDHHHEEDGA